MKIQCQGEMVPSSAGLAAPAEITDRCIRDESEQASLGLPHTLAQALQPQVEWDSPCASQTPGIPRSCPSPPAGRQSLPQEWAPCQRWAWGGICVSRGPWGTPGWQGSCYQGLLQMLLTSFPS